MEKTYARLIYKESAKMYCKNFLTSLAIDVNQE
jgi:hypothetical protein